MIYVTGDTHGQIDRFEEKAVKKLTKHDTLIVLGDFGFVWGDTKEEKKHLKWLTKRRYQLLFIDGCHENYDLLEEYPLVDYHGGKARHLGGSLYWVQRGSVLEIEGKKLLLFGGGESVDRDDRDEGVNWWRAEMPGTDEMERCTRNLAACGNQVDYILTHDAPQSLGEFAGVLTQQPNWLHAYFDRLMQQVQYKTWLFGRYHRDQRISSRARAVFCDLIPLED